MKNSLKYAPEIIEKVAQFEELNPVLIHENLKNGHAIILGNPNHKNVNPVAVGKDMKVKINANIGMSPMHQDFDNELKKLDICEKYKVDAIMDLSLGEGIRKLRRMIIEKSSIPLGTVPLYETFYRNDTYPENLIDTFLEILEESGQDGVDFVVIHAGILQRHLELAKNRVIKVTSRGGSFMMRWMEKHNQENFLYKNFDKVLAICKKYNMTISLGDGMRPAAIADETDEAQLEELRVLGDLVLRCRQAGVQAMVEGPGHIPFHKIKQNIDLQKQYCHGSPFYVLGPLVTDIAPGYDHITAAIGATMAAHCGADFLCYVTPSEHIALPDLEDVKQGIIAFKIAAHAANVAKGKDTHLDRKMSEARSVLDWESQRKYVLDIDTFEKYRERLPENFKVCTMCGDFCALK